MLKKSPSLLLFIISGFLYFIATLLESETFSLLTKPIIIPSIIFFYFTKTRGKVNFWFVFSLLLFFVGDILYLMNIEENYFYGLIFYLSPYLIVLTLIFKEFLKLLKNRNLNETDVSFLIILFFLVYLLANIIEITNPSSKIEFVYFLLYAIVLVLMGVLATLLYLHKPTKSNFFLIITVSLFLISDISFILHKNVYGLLVFKIINIVTQITSYYFYVKYLIEKRNFS